MGFPLARLAVPSNPELVELLHERTDNCWIVRKNTRFEVAAVLGFRPHSSPRQIRAFFLGDLPIDYDCLEVSAGTKNHL